MSSESVSPDRPPDRKTYLSRSKKRKDTPNDTNPSSESEEDIIMTDAKSPSKASDAKSPSKASDAKPAKPQSKASDAKPAKPQSKASRKDTAPPAPVSPGKVPKKVEIHLPGPSPRSAKTEAQNSSPAVKKAKTAQHNRSVSSISSMKGIIEATDSPSSKKPISSVSRKRLATPEDADDNASVAESSMSMGVGAIRRTEAERIEYFNNQPDCSNIEPHNVTCTRCSKVVQLGKKQTYTVKPWETHRKRCDQKYLLSGSVVDDGASVRSDIRSEAGGPVRMNEAQRKAALEADPRAETVQVDQVLCRKCNKWIRLSTRTNYSLGNWTTHQQSCADAVVSSRVAMAQRKISLVNDPQAKTSGPRNVECRICGTNVALAGDFDYTLKSWDEHKQTCPPSSSSSKGKAAKTPRPPRSSASTEATVVAGASSEASSSRGTKRRLEDPELDVEDPDARHPNRPRKESYEPVQKEPPSMLGWFLMPFKAFIQGVKESIAETPP